MPILITIFFLLLTIISIDLYMLLRKENSFKYHHKSVNRSITFYYQDYKLQFQINQFKK